MPDGGRILDDIQRFIQRFNVFPSQHCAPMLALWYAHTHLAHQFYVTPRLILSSAEPGSGKTRVLEVAQFLVYRPEMILSPSTAALFRMITEKPLTILFDEVDTVFNPKASGTEDLRGMLNAGYKRTATIPRCVTENGTVRVEKLRVYSPAALAGIAGHMPTTITTRAITVHMRRRGPGETVEPFREQTVEAEAVPLRDALAGWAASIADTIGATVPTMPDGVTDRPAEIWEPLLAIAEAAGGDWPETARAACRHFVIESATAEEASLGVRLLADIRAIYQRDQVDRMPTARLLWELNDMEEAPWGDLHGKPLDGRRLAKELGRYGVKPTVFRDGGKTPRGYTEAGETGLSDAWSRYLPPDTRNERNIRNTAGQLVALPDRVADTSATPDSAATALTSNVADVSHVAPPQEGWSA
ncbi:hypothetical protein FHR81_002019 [Actinoalloteichus hoggarensis]|uniref:Uncharacterized protein n=1 Tax=Actinoalloteichus hoggarensis TaxID=1470176 RepID=A0A221W560_9PSEU|nr:DUF3631 domain-containing protein [Actinoalloteichus hoggarensis]ASO21050.1 hypothetical protein AHOG_17125 [Actinoalloteichus hoggarensis]MBB5920981.1 hypothetical protein [Actinoalloteichus hoggarensis]